MVLRSLVVGVIMISVYPYNIVHVNMHMVVPS
jgi:hypothetical protein